MKKALIIAYFFPPLGGSGVQRTLKFVKYLPQFGILPVVSTIRSGHNFAYDESLLKEVPPEVKVYRSNSLETLWLRSLIERISVRKRSQQKSAAPQDNNATNGTNATNETNTSEKTAAVRSLKQRVFDFIDNYLFVPDSKVRWLPFGFVGSLQAARREQVDYLFSSSYPYTVHLIALLVKKFHHKPWIADFRDPWVGNEAMAKDLEFRRKVDAWLERKVVKNADYVINVTAAITEMYQERYPEYRHKFRTITNGFDPEDFQHIKPIAQEKFTLIHTGILSKRRDPGALVQGLEKLAERRPELIANTQALFVGKIPDEFLRLFEQSSLARIFEVKEYVPHHICLNYLAGAHLLLLIFDDSPETKAAYSGKIFDYIGIEKPILGILPEGVAAELIREKGIGTVVQIGDAEGVEKAVEKYYDEWLAGGTAMESAKKCAEFSRVNLAGQLAGLLAEIQ